MSKIIEFKIGKGRTSRPTEAEEWTKTYFEATVRMPERYTEDDLHEAVTRAEYFVDDIIGAPEVGAIPQLDITQVNSLAWKKRNKEPAQPGEFAWLFGPGSRGGTERGAEGLVKAIQTTKDGKLVIGDMEYSLAKADAFIQRKPVKT